MRRALNNEVPGERDAPRKNNIAQDTKREQDNHEEEEIESKHSSKSTRANTPPPSPRSEEEQEEPVAVRILWVEVLILFTMIWS